MEYNFCTLFDSYYLTRGLVLYYSLVATCKEFHLFIFAFDDKCYLTLQNLNLRNVTLISLNEFEDEDLLRVKPTRTIAEYCWTCTASTLWYSFEKFNLSHCTYLDADMMFFSTPSPIFEAIGNHSVGITPHNFNPKFKSSEIYGKYCVQFVYFKNDKDGLEALNWWRKSCINWCFAKLENNKYGDQKYLDYFVANFSNVTEITHIGVGVAPWNIANFNIELNANNIQIFSRKRPNQKFPLIFYHYQGLKFTLRDRIVSAEASNVKIAPFILDQIYLPYINNLIKTKNQITGGDYKPDRIVFFRKISTILNFNIKLLFRRFIKIVEIYYSIKKKKYVRPKGIGSEA